MPPPDGKLSFADLVKFVGASPNTVRSVVEHLGIEPERPGGTVTWYTQENALAVRAHYHIHGGHYRPRKKARKSRRKRHSPTVARN